MHDGKWGANIGGLGAKEERLELAKEPKEPSPMFSLGSRTNVRTNVRFCNNLAV